MILQALTAHYETLVARGELASPGWSKAKISYALCINGAGELEDTVSLQVESTRGKKKVLVPREMDLPAAVGRTVGIASNFLWDHSGYLLGVDNKGKPRRSMECFEACRQLHKELLSDAGCPEARALLAFFDRWNPASAREHPVLAERWEEITAGGNLVFRYGGAYLQEVPALRAAWQRHYDNVGCAEPGQESVCLVTGQRGPVEATHPMIKGFAGAQPSGAALVSFNAPAFCSYGKEQNLNAPTGKYAAFAYTAALKYLLADREHVRRIGDTTVLFWAEGGQSAYQNLFASFLFGAPSGSKAPVYSPADLEKTMDSLCRGDAVLFDDTRLDPNCTFYILGLSPNAARLSVRFFLKNTFGAFVQNVNAHQMRLEIARPSDDELSTIPLWKLLDETVNQNARDKSPLPGLAGETLRAVLNNTRYPATLLNGVMLRLRAERKLTHGRAAIIKAYYLQNPHPDVPKEVLTVSLNSACTDIPYTLGRLFSVYEAIQSAANPGINATIVDKYFNAASATPSRIFPTLGKLANTHLKKLRRGKPGLCINFEKQIGDLSGKIGQAYPDRLSLPQQGSFQLGYYQQKQARYAKEEKENV